MPRWDAATIAAHNAEVDALWEGYWAGTPSRVPVSFNFSKRFYLLTPWLNAPGWTFRDYFEKPEIQWEVQLRMAQWICENVSMDSHWGLPEQWGGLAPDFQNSYEAAWLGCPIVYFDYDTPDTVPMLQQDKGKLASLSIPDPLQGGIADRAMECYRYLEERRARAGFCDRPVGKSAFVGGGTDGPFTVACSLRGATELCLDLYEDPRFVHELLDFITEAALVRIRGVAAFHGTSLPQQQWGFADDSIQLLSVAQYREFVLPYHQRLVAACSAGGPNSMHLCGDVQRHLPVVQQELNVQSFDLGFPTDLAQARRELGPGATLRGNLHPRVLSEGPPSLIREQTQAVMESGVKEGGHFLFCEGNNTAPGTPAEHFDAAYEAAQEFGRYTE